MTAAINENSPGAPVHCVLLDMDGTLTDTAPGLYAALNELLHENNLSSAQTDPSLAGNGADAMLRHALQLAGTSAVPESMRRRFLRLYEDQLQRTTSDNNLLFPDMHRVLKEIVHSGRRWGVVTNKAEHLASLVLQRTGLSQCCACLVGGDTLAKCKPHPDPLWHACRLLSVQPEHTIYIGDSRNDVLAGLRAGIRVLYAAYGYNDGYPSDLPAAHGIIARPADILSWLDQERRDRQP